MANTVSGLRGEIEPGGLDKAVLHLEHRHALDGLRGEAINQLVIEHLVAEQGSGKQLGPQGRVVESVLGVSVGMR